VRSPANSGSLPLDRSVTVEPRHPHLVLSTPSILDLFRSSTAGFHDMAGQGADRRARALHGEDAVAVGR
jgi:hypothetical protein